MDTCGLVDGNWWTVLDTRRVSLYRVNFVRRHLSLYNEDLWTLETCGQIHLLSCGPGNIEMQKMTFHKIVCNILVNILFREITRK